MRSLLTKSERSLIREQIVRSTQPGPERETRLYKWLCGDRVFKSRRHYFEALVKIPDKRSAGRKIIPFTLNKPQRNVEAVRLRYTRAKLPFRGATLKARQWGMSTYWLAAMIEEVTRNENVRACLLADEEALAKTLLETGKIVRDHLPFRLPTKYENRQQLYFDSPINGWIDIATAKSQNPCRGRTYSFLHATEPGTWDDPERKVASVNQSVPNHENTVLSYEGTANGTGNWWHDFWWDAFNGNNDYHAFFFPWWYDPEFDYCLLLAEGDEERIVSTLDEEERELIRMGVGVGSLKWRRFAIRNQFFGDLDLFHQEFPATPEEAWLASGRPVFNSRHIARARSRAIDPLWVGDIVLAEEGKDQGQQHLLPNPRGALTIWAFPDPDRTYVLSTDTAEGTDSGDWSLVEVLDKESLDQVAEWRAKLGAGELARASMALGFYYNEGYVLPDAGDGPGGATMQVMVELAYPNIGRRPVYGAIGKRTVPKWGWDTNRQTKYLMVNECRMVLGLEDCPAINSTMLLAELLEYQINDDGTYSAPPGRHDDCVEAYCVALMAQKDVLVRGIMKPPEKLPDTEDGWHWKEFEDSVRDPEDEDDDDPLE